MSCDNPILGEITEDGKPLKIIGPLSMYYHLYHHNKVSFDFRKLILVPCGKCLSCRLDRAREWSLRCKHELQMCDNNACFLTLTYNDDHVPYTELASFTHPYTLCRADYQNFFKRLRRRISPVKIRYFGCGEYGSNGFRPHYHFIVFGWMPDDLKPISYSGGNFLYRSAFLDDVWSLDGKPIGFVSVGTVTDDSIKYVARYAAKKLSMDTSSCEVQPFVVASNRPGIGATFFEKFSGDFLKFDEDGILYKGTAKEGEYDVGIPRYYRKRLALSEPETADELSDLYRGAVATRITSWDSLVRAYHASEVKQRRFEREFT